MTDSGKQRVAFAFVALLAAVAIGSGYIIRSGGDPGHLVGGFNAAPDATPTTCRYNTVRPSEAWTQIGLDYPDGGNGLAAAKSCYNVPTGCESEDAHVYDPADSGANPVPCEDRDGSLFCPDATIPWATFNDRCAIEPVVLPLGIEHNSYDEWERPYIPGEPVFEVWTAEHKDAPWRCACGGPGFVPDAGVCERYVALYGKHKETITISPGMTFDQYPRLDGGVWEPIPPVEQTMSYKPGEWRGNCRKMPCGTWAGMNPLPAECRVHACDGLECGMGRAGELCGPEKSYRKKSDAGEDLTCAANKWEAECEKVCSKPSKDKKGKKGKWYVAECPPCEENP
jgi:hypothetical protein